METENYIKCYEVLRDNIGNLCKWNWEINDMEKHKRKRKISKAFIEQERVKLALSKEYFRGMCEMAKLTGEFTYPIDGKCSIDSEFGWYFE